VVCLKWRVCVHLSRGENVVNFLNGDDAMHNQSWAWGGVAREHLPSA
jgi:hypothetical protein